MKKNIDDLLAEYEEMFAAESNPPENPQPPPKQTLPQQVPHQPAPQKNISQQPAPQQLPYQPNTAPPPKPQPIQQQPQPPKAPQLSLIEVEKQFTQIPAFKSFMLIQSELQGLASLMKQPFVANNEKNLDYYTQLKKGLINQLNLLLDFIDTGKLRAAMYDKFIMESMKLQKQSLDQAQSQNEGLFVKRISKRMMVLKNEMQLMKQNPEESFAKIVSYVKPGFKIPQLEAPKSRDEIKSQVRQQLKDSHKLANFKATLDADKILSIDIDSKPVIEKYEALLRRYQEYYNFLVYLSNHKKEERKEQLDRLFLLMEKGKFLREQFTKGANPEVANYLINELRPLDFITFHLMNQNEYKLKVGELFRCFNEALQKEREFEKKALHCKRMPNLPVQPIQQSRQRLEAYKQQLAYLQALSAEQWVLLPEIAAQEIDVQICIENKEIPPNILKLAFIKLGNCKFEKYFLSFVLESGKSVVSEKTPICNEGCVFNYNYNIEMAPNVDYSSRIIEVRLYEKGYFSNSEISVTKIGLEELRQSNSFDGIAQFPTNKGNITLSYNLQVREPLNKFSTFKVNLVRIAKQFPPFDSQAGMKEFLSKWMVQLPTYEQCKAQLEAQERERQEKEQRLKQMQIEEQQAKQAQQQSQQQSQQQAAPTWPLIVHLDTDPSQVKIKEFLSGNPALPEGLEANDLLYPENPSKFPVFNFIQPYCQFVSDQTVILRQEPSNRPWFRFVQNMYEDFLRQQTIIQKKLENEQFDWYISKISNLMPKEQFLMQVYAQLNCPIHLAFVKRRAEILEKELEEISQME